MKRIVFMGTPRFGQIILQALLAEYHIAGVVTQPDRTAGRGNKLVVSPVKQMAQEHGLPLMQPERVREAGAIEQLKQLAPDVIVVAAFGQILPPAILSIPPHGCLNVHASLLPRYRGASPIPAAILADDPCTGVTIMLMEAGLDTGPIIRQQALAITSDDTTESLTERLGHEGAKLLLQTLPSWIAGEITPQPQDEEQATFTHPIAMQDARIDWQSPADRIARQVRAMYPWPIAYTAWAGRKLQILRARPCRADVRDAEPGQVAILGRDIAVATGDGWLILDEVQLAGKRRMPVEAFVRGQRGFVGAILG